MNNIGALFLGGVPQTGNTNWPYYATARPRSMLVWSLDGNNLFMVNIGYQSSLAISGPTWNQTIAFLSDTFTKTVRGRPELRGFQIGDAVMLDGGFSTQLSDLRVSQDGTVVPFSWRVPGIGGRNVPTVVRAYATIP